MFVDMQAISMLFRTWLQALQYRFKKIFYNFFFLHLYTILVLLKFLFKYTYTRCISNKKGAAFFADFIYLLKMKILTEGTRRLRDSENFVIQIIR